MHAFPFPDAMVVRFLQKVGNAIKESSNRKDFSKYVDEVIQAITAVPEGKDSSSTRGDDDGGSGGDVSEDGGLDGADEDDELAPGKMLTIWPKVERWVSGM